MTTDAIVTTNAARRRHDAVVNHSGTAGLGNRKETRELVTGAHAGWTRPSRSSVLRPRAGSRTRTPSGPVTALDDTDFFDSDNWDSGPLR